MKDALLDIVRHTGNLGFVEVVKITGTETETIIEAIDKDRTLIIKGKLTVPDQALKGEFGVGNMTRLYQLLTHTNFGADTAQITVEEKNERNRKFPIALHFTDSQKQKAIFRLMSLDFVPDQPRFVGSKWDVTIKPTKSKIAELASMISMYGSVDTYLTFKVVKNELQVWVGSETSATDSMFIKVADDLVDVKPFEMCWPHAQVMSILKSGQDESPEVLISTRGAMQINLNGQQGQYNYILPARK